MVTQQNFQRASEKKIAQQNEQILEKSGQLITKIIYEILILEKRANQ